MIANPMVAGEWGLGPGARNSEPAGGGDSDPERLRVTVIFTTIEGTLAALSAAARLARGLGTEIVLLVAEVVYFRYPLEHPPVGADFFEKLAVALTNELDLKGQEIGLEVHFCRDRVRRLMHSLRPRSLVVIGEKKCWWHRRERKLERALERVGHDVVLVHASSEPGAVHTRSVVDYLLTQVNAT